MAIRPLGGPLGGRRRAVAARLAAPDWACFEPISCRARTFASAARARHGYATSPSARRRRTVLFQYGGPRLGERAGTSVGSPSAARKRAIALGSVSRETS